MQVVIRNMAGEQVDELELPAEVFEAPINTALMHQALVRQLANARQGTHSTLSRGEVNRTKAKWYRQKGTGCSCAATSLTWASLGGTDRPPLAEVSYTRSG